MNENDVLKVRGAVTEVLNNGKVPLNLPPSYRQHLLDLADARDDRTAGRKDKFERAVKNLLPFLALTSPHMPGSPHINRLLAQWKMVCSNGPAPLPVPVLHEKLEYIYGAQDGETIADVALRFGFDNPGPLCHPSYGYSPFMRLRLGDKVYIPLPPRQLEYFIDAAEKLIEQAHEGLKDAIENLHAANEEFESFLLTIEAVSIIVNIGNAAREGIMLGAKVVKTVTNRYAEMLTEEAIEMLRLEMGKTSAEIFGMAVESSHAQKKGFFLYLRHSPIGMLSPTYWTSFAVALFTMKDFEAYFYGPEGVLHKRIEELTRQTEHHIYTLNQKLDVMRSQLESPVYRYRL